MNIQDYIKVLERGWCDHCGKEMGRICTVCLTDLSTQLETLTRLLIQRRRLEVIAGVDRALQLIQGEEE